MDSNFSILNNYLVEFFNGILKIEENSLGEIDGKLSLREMHTIEAIINAAGKSAGEIAAKLNITLGTLSVALKTLEKKGYIRREKSESDRRKMRVFSTEKGIAVNKRHQDFHHKMVNEIMAHLSEKELSIFMTGVEKLNRHFTNLDTLG